MERVEQFSQHDGFSYGIVVSGHYHMDDTYAIRRPAGMDDWLITLTLGGRGYYDTPEGRRECGEGDVVLLKPNTPHAYGTVQGATWHFVWAHFTNRAVGDQLLPREALYVDNLEPGSMRARLDQAFRRMLSDSRERSEYWHDLCVNSLREILILLSQRRSRALDPRVSETLHYLSERMGGPVRIDGLARTIGLSASRLSHLFKEQTGLSIIDALNRMRIRQATLLLEHTNRSATEVAYDVGFHNYNHFIVQFKKWAGTTPSGFRQRKIEP